MENYSCFFIFCFSLGLFLHEFLRFLRKSRVKNTNTAIFTKHFSASVAKSPWKSLVKTSKFVKYTNNKRSVAWHRNYNNIAKRFCFSMPVLYSAGGENCFRRCCANMVRTDFCKCGIAAGRNVKNTATEKRKTIKNSDAPALRLLNRWSGREIKKREQTQRNT